MIQIKKQLPSINIEKIITGNYYELLEIYRTRSIVIGRNVKIMSDPIDGSSELIAEGKVKAIGDNLELFLEGVDEPITKGRLILQYL